MITVRARVERARHRVLDGLQRAEQARLHVDNALQQVAALRETLRDGVTAEVPSPAQSADSGVGHAAPAGDRSTSEGSDCA